MDPTTLSSFRSLLENASPDQLEAFKQEATSLTIQHHLTRLSNDIEQQIQQLESSIFECEKLIAQLAPADIGLRDCKKLHAQFAALRNKGFHELKLLEKGLAIAWNSNRPDLIERLSRNKEHLQNFIHAAIGQSLSENFQDSGLYSLLQRHLESVFGGLQDDLLAEEALIGIDVRLEHPVSELKTLLDLKHAMIYSQKALNEWLSGERV